MDNKIIFEDGMHEISIDDYHNASAYSRSQLYHFSKSPYHFWYHVLSGKAKEKPESKDLITGKLLHSLVLEPDYFRDNFVVHPKFDRRTTKGKEQYAAFIAENESKIWLDEDEYDVLLAMKESIEAHDDIMQMISDGNPEKSFFWTDKESGIQFKCRPDLFLGGAVIDLKTSRSASQRTIEYDCIDKGYYLQAAMIEEGLKEFGINMKVFALLVIEKHEPYAVRVFSLSPVAMEYGRKTFKNYKSQLAKCIEQNKWPGYSSVEISPSKYHVEEMEMIGGLS